MEDVTTGLWAEALWPLQRGSRPAFVAPEADGPGTGMSQLFNLCKVCVAVC